MIIYKDNQTGQYYELLYIQNPAVKATPYVEPTLWFQPLEVDFVNKIPKGLKRKAGEWARPMAEKLVSRYLTVFTGPLVQKIEDTAPSPKKGEAQKAVNLERGADEEG